MERIFFNGLIKTLDDADSLYEAVGVDNGKIVFLGSDEEAAALECDERTDLDGKLMLPGFVDSHLHMLHYAFVQNSVKLFDCTSVEEMLALVKKRYDEDTEGSLPWIFARGWNEEHFIEKRYPSKQELDAISDEIPIIMVRVCGHTAVSNTPGLELLQKIKEYSEIESEVNLENGTLKENAVQFFYSILEAPSEEEVRKLLKLGMEHLNRAGITGIQSDDLASLPGKNWRRIMNAYKHLDEEGGMTARVYEQCLFERFEDLKVFIGEGYRTGQSGNCYTIGPVKLLQDGSLGARTAAMREPYEGQEENRGIVIYEQDELNEILKFCDDNHMQVAVHCIGDRAMDMVIEAITKSASRAENPKNRHGIVHVQISNADVLQKMKDNNILAYIQPVFVDDDMEVVESRIGAHRMDKIYAWNTMLEMGIHAAGGSDAPVVSFDVMENIYFAVTRQKLNGTPEGGWLPEEKVSVEEAVKLFTKYPAYTSYSEEVNGTIEMGKNADFVVLDENIYEVSPERIKDIQINMTVLAGKTVYSGV